MNSNQDDRIRTWTDPDGHGFKLELIEAYDCDSGEDVVAYIFYHKEEVIFEGDLNPSLHDINSDEFVRVCLSFLSLRPGDADREYFDYYSERQVEWAREWGETLSLYSMEPENTP